MIEKNLMDSLKDNIPQFIPWREHAVGDKTYSALDRSEREHVLGSVAAVAAPGLVAGIISLLQDELLALELRVLITHPATPQGDMGERTGRDRGEERKRWRTDRWREMEMGEKDGKQ